MCRLTLTIAQGAQSVRGVCHAPTSGIEAYRGRTDSAPFDIKETCDIKETFLLTRGIEKYVVAGPTYELDLPPTMAA